LCIENLNKRGGNFMKKGIFSMAVLLIAAITVFGLTGLSFAQEQTNGGPGDALLFPYYDARSVAEGGLGLTDNYFSVINTSDQWIQSHVRIRTGDCSVELLDFDILQSPKDIFVFDIYEDGGITFASCDKNTLEDSGFTLNYDADGDGDNDCFIISADSFPDMLSLITTCGDCATGGTITSAQAIGLVKKGYIEVIEEGVVHRKTSDKTLCYDVDGNDPSGGITIPGKTLRDLWDTECTDDIYAPEAELQGRQYFVEVNTSVSPVMVKRLAQSNAAILDYDSDHGLFLHENTYADELASDQCNDDDGYEQCYAYAEAETTDGVGEVVDNGANDMNRCFYVDDIDGDAVINKFGAAATFGPTLADIYDPRDGYLDTTMDNLYESGLSAFDLVEYFWTYEDDWTKQYVDSHYFYAPSPGAYDMTTAFAFTFPLKHFIGEKETIKAVEIYDNSENTTTIEIGKFISPGLPTPATYAEEAQLFKLTPPFNEGWIRFEVSATNSTAGCLEPFDSAPGTDCQVYGYDKDYGSGASTYVPAYMGLVFTTGAENLGVSPFSYNNENILWSDNGQSGDSR
jgi:hypothetical protein